MCPVSSRFLPPPSIPSLCCELVKPTEKLFNITRLRQRSDEALFGLILVRALDMEFNLVQLSSARRGKGKGKKGWLRSGCGWLDLICIRICMYAYSLGTTNMCAKCPMLLLLLQKSVKLAADFRALALLIQMKAIQ